MAAIVSISRLHPVKPDAIAFPALNRFFRNVAEMELTIRKLRKHGVRNSAAEARKENKTVK
jgi:hypothetical protein